MATSFAIEFFHWGIKGKRFQMNLCKIASAATIYHIWLQRKTMNPNRNVQIEGIFQAIKDDVRRRVGFFFKEDKIASAFVQTCILMQESKSIQQIIGN